MLRLILGAAVITAAVSSASAQQWASASERGDVAAPSRAAVEQPVITHGQIARLKATLKLKSEQLSHWAAVENALHDIARNRSAVSDMANKLRRLKAVAGPLLRTLDDSQRSQAIAFAHSIGYGQLAASF
jgi:hypothetical protein